MKTPDKDKLIGFYFGSVDDEDRLGIEKEMLKDPEVLLDYLDLKRSLENAVEVPAKPTPALWARLQRIPRRRKNVFLAFSAVAAAALIIFFYMGHFNQTEGSPDLGGGILFDTRGEHSSVSNVL